MYQGVTPIQRMGSYLVKREDLAHWQSLEYPSGSKVRQYELMAYDASSRMQGSAPWRRWNGEIFWPPCIVGCSANSAMAVYVAATANRLGTKGIIYTAKRKKRTEGIIYAESMGAEINEVAPGYLSLIRQKARERAKEIGETVRWSPELAIQDTIKQCQNIPDDVERIVIPTGSGLTAAAIMMGLIGRINAPTVVAVATSSMTTREGIIARASKGGHWELLPPLEFIPATGSYNDYEIHILPDGTPCDPFYSAKAVKYLRPQDLFWPVGLRSVISMPKECQNEFKAWKGPERPEHPKGLQVAEGQP